MVFTVSVQGIWEAGGTAISRMESSGTGFEFGTGGCMVVSKGFQMLIAALFHHGWPLRTLVPICGR
jgi:hypothetical protein